VTPDEVRALLFSERTERDKQRAVGPSEVGGCRRRVWHRLQETPVTNPGTMRMPSSMGTAFHSWVEKRLVGNPRFLLEQRVERDGLRGTVDCFDVETSEVIDWKTIKMSGVPRFPYPEQWWQVQLYAWMLSQEREVKSVCLVAFPRDGTELNILAHVQPYREATALEGIEWLRDVASREEAPRPEKMARVFCKPYCGFWDPTGLTGCQGL